MQELKTDIRRATAQDLREVRNVGIDTFVESFSAMNTAEDMALYVQKSFDERTLLKELNEPDVHYYLALQGDEAVGYLKLNFGDAQTELKDHKAVEIERIYVRKAFQNRHLGQQLFQKALEIAVQLNLDYVWLGVWEKNRHAIRFYERNGFAAFSRHIFKLGNDEQTDIMMKLPLKK